MAAHVHMHKQTLTHLLTRDCSDSCSSSWNVFCTRLQKIRACQFDRWPLYYSLEEEEYTILVFDLCHSINLKEEYQKCSKDAEFCHYTPTIQNIHNPVRQSEYELARMARYGPWAVLYVIN